MFDTSTTRAQLQLVIRHWPDLEQLATSRPHDAWPPTSLQTYARTPEEYDPMDRSAPVRLHVLDTARHIEGQLLHAATRIAADIQRPAISHAPADWAPADRALRDAIADEDAADPRRWRYVGPRTAADAATWLHARLTAMPGGPFRPLSLQHLDRIRTVAETAATHVQHALGLARRSVPIPGRPCACGGTLHLHGGDGAAPEVACEACGRRWTQETVSAA